MANLLLFFLGSPYVEFNGVPTSVRRRKAVALLAYMAVGKAAFPRDTLATLLWPESGQSHARAALRSTLWTLRRAFGAEFLEVTAEQVGLKAGTGLWVDVDHFHRRLAECRQHGHPASEVCPACLEPLGQAVGLYRDDFLAGFSVPDAPAFEEWLVLQAEQLRQEVIPALERLALGHGAQGEWGQAIVCAQRWLGLDPLHEPAHRLLMRLHTWAGRRSAALRQYQVCRETLQRELGLLPEEETVRLARDIEEGQLPSLPGPLAALAPHGRHNLPAQPAPFVGREEELAEVGRLLRDPQCRLLTLVGPGGIGKTRLALQAAQEQVGAFTHGVYLVPLDALAVPELLPASIATALQFPFQGREEQRVQLLNYLREKELLLVLDSFDRLEGGAHVLVEILERAPGVKALVTSRERLNLRWEWLVDVAGLAFPEDGLIAEAERYSAVQLFVQSARRVRAGFRLQEEQRAVVQICQLVQGLPLAIELAAAAVGRQPCAEIAQEVGHSLGVLRSPWLDVPARHRSLRAAFDYSWDTLTEKEQAAFRRLAVFRGGFSREAAAEVARAGPEVLSELLEKSLLRRTPRGRYQMLDVVWQYARERLGEMPEEEESTGGRHCAYYAAFLEGREHDLEGVRQREAVQEIGEEIENVRVGWNWAVERRDVEALNRSLGSLYLFYWLRYWSQEGAEVFGKATARLGATGDADATPCRAHLLARQASLYDTLGRSEEARELLEESLALFRGLSLRREAVFALCTQGRVLATLGRHTEARDVLEEGLALSREAGERWSVAHCLLAQAKVAAAQGEYAQALRLYQESLEIAQDMGNQRAMANALRGLGQVHFRQAHYAEASRFLQGCLSLTQGDSDRYERGAAFSYLGLVAQAQGEYFEAKRYYEEALTIARELGYRAAVVGSLTCLGDLCNVLGEHDQAEQLLREALLIGQEIGDREDMAAALTNLGNVAEARGAYAEAKRYHEQVEDICREMGHRMGLAISLCNQGEESYWLGDHQEAERLLGESLVILREIGDRQREAYALTLLGFTACGTGDEAKAGQHFRHALRVAVEIEAAPRMLDALLGVALLLGRKGEQEPALELLALGLHHPASEHGTRRRAAQLLAELESRCAPQMVAGAMERGKNRDLKEVVMKILEGDTPSETPV